MVPHLDTIATVRSVEHELALSQVGRGSRLVAPRAAVLPLTCLLTLATGVVLLVLAWTITPPDVPLVAAAAPSAGGLATVQAFYAAANVATLPPWIGPSRRIWSSTRTGLASRAVATVSSSTLPGSAPPTPRCASTSRQCSPMVTSSRHE